MAILQHTAAPLFKGTRLAPRRRGSDVRAHQARSARAPLAPACSLTTTRLHLSKAGFAHSSKGLANANKRSAWSVSAEPAATSNGSASKCPMPGVGEPVAEAAPSSGLWSKLLTVVSALACAGAVDQLLAHLAAPLVARCFAFLFTAAAGAILKIQVAKWWGMFQYRHLKLPPMVNDDRHPLLGHLPRLLKEKPGKLTFQLEIEKKMGLVYSLDIPTESPYPTAVIADPAQVRKVLNLENEAIVNKWPESLMTLIGEQSVTAVLHDTHRKLRQVHMSILNERNVQTVAAPMIADLLRTSLASWAEKGWFDVLPTTRNFTFQMSMEFILTGEQVEPAAYETMKKDFDILGTGVFARPPAGYPGSPYPAALEARHRLADQIRAYYDEFRPKYEAGLVGQSSAMSALLAAGEAEGIEVTADLFVDQFINLLFAGTDTTSQTMVWICKYMAENPEVCAKLRAEVDAAALPADGTFPVGPYTKAFVREVIRLHPVVATVFRKTIKPLELDDGITVPAGWKLWLRLDKSVHTSSPSSAPGQIAPAEEFSPERWINSDGTGLLKTPAEYIPFGAGGRTCLGMALAWNELEQLVAAMAQGYDVSVQTEIEGSDAQPSPSLSSPGLFAKVVPRADGQPADSQRVTNYEVA